MSKQSRKLRLREGKELAHSHREQLTESALEFGSLSPQISLPWLLGLLAPGAQREVAAEGEPFAKCLWVRWCGERQSAGGSRPGLAVACLVFNLFCEVQWPQ